MRDSNRTDSFSDERPPTIIQPLRGAKFLADDLCEIEGMRVCLGGGGKKEIDDINFCACVVFLKLEGALPFF